MNMKYVMFQMGRNLVRELFVSFNEFKGFGFYKLQFVRLGVFCIFLYIFWVGVGVFRFRVNFFFFFLIGFYYIFSNNVVYVYNGMLFSYERE